MLSNDPSIGHKIDKAKHYAEQPDRVALKVIEADIHGDNGEHHVSFSLAGGWQCQACSFFKLHGSCVHILTLQKVFNAMLPENQRFPLFDAEARKASVRPN
jgi:hypothetical protein